MLIGVLSTPWLLIALLLLSLSGQFRSDREQRHADRPDDRSWDGRVAAILSSKAKLSVTRFRKSFIYSIDEGIILEALTRGVLAGYSVDDVRVELYGGSFHEIDSSEMAFKIPGSMAFQDAGKKARPVLLERRDLRLPTQSRATYSMHFDRYEPVPGGPHDDLAMA